MEGKKIYNDAIDEEELEDEVEIIEQTEIKNQLVDEEVNRTDDSQNYIPTPQDEEEENQSQHNVQNSKVLQPTQPQQTQKNLPTLDKELENINLDEDTREIFKYMDDFEKKEITLLCELKPFIPNYIPAVGEVDAHLKIPRPDKNPNPLGLELLDEPALNTSKKSYLDFLIKEFYKKRQDSERKVHSLANVHKNPKQIQGGGQGWGGGAEE